MCFHTVFTSVTAAFRFQVQADGTPYPENDEAMRYTHSFNLHCVLNRKGRVTVVVEKDESVSPPKERILAAAYWFQPGVRIRDWEVIQVVKDGIWPCLRTSGWAWIAVRKSCCSGYRVEVYSYSVSNL